MSGAARGACAQVRQGRLEQLYAAHRLRLAFGRAEPLPDALVRAPAAAATTAVH